MIGKKSVLGAIALIVLMAAIGAISASAGNDHPQRAKAQLVGSWMVTVNRGPALPPLKSLQTFTKGHGVIETSNAGATVRSPAHGAWNRIGGRAYGSTMVFFRYDSSGAFIGTLKLRRTLEVAHDGQSFTGGSVAELRDANGNLLPGSNTRLDAETAERINVEPVPALP